MKYVIPNPTPLLEAFKGHPQPRSFVNWYEDNNGRKPTASSTPMNDPSTHLTLEEALDTKQPVGLAMSPEHTYIAFDIDGVDASSEPTLDEFFKANPSYEEASPSGKPYRRRRLYEIMNPQDKNLFKNQGKTPFADNTEIALYVNTGYVTLTGEESNGLPIAMISPDDIISTFPKFKASQGLSTATHNENLTPAGLTFPMETIKLELWVKQVSLDRTDPVVQRIMADTGKNFYDYWVLGLMALRATHGYAAKAYAEEWSRTDPEWDTYSDPEKDFFETWNSIQDKLNDNDIGPGTYYWLFDSFTVKWALTNDKGKPLPNEASNIQALLDHYDLHIVIDAITHHVMIDGPDTSLYPFFYVSQEDADSRHMGGFAYVSGKIHDFCRPHNFHPTFQLVDRFVKHILATQPTNITDAAFIDAVNRTTLDSTTDWLTLIARDIVQRDSEHEHEHPTQELHEILVRKWLISLGRTLWPEEMNQSHRHQANEGMLILSGKEGGIGKSTFAQLLLPVEWRHLYTEALPRFLGGGGSDKDYKLQTSPTLIVNYDEAERILTNRAEAHIKSEITARFDDYRAPYDIDTMRYLRRYSIIASTNQEQLNIPRTGARRYWWINVKNIDLTTMTNMDIMQVWAHIKHEVINSKTKNPPWILTNEERKELESFTGEKRMDNSLELYMKDMYAFTPEGYDRKYIMITDEKLSAFESTVGVVDMCRLLGDSYSAANVKRALENLTDEFAPDMQVKRTLVKNGKVTIGGQKRYLLPISR